MNVLEYDELSGQADDERDKAVRKYLTTNGWKYTCDHPGSVWLWTIAKDLSTYDAQVYAVNEEMALRFQRYWELEAQHFVAHDADCPIFTTFDWDDCDCIVQEFDHGHVIEGDTVDDDIAVLDGEE